MTLNIAELTETWQHLHALAHDAIAPINDETSYNRALTILEELLLHVGEDDTHPLADLVEGLITRVTSYQDKAGHVPPPTPAMQLRLLLAERGVTQQTVARATGIPQGNLSRLASGKRNFTAAHARALADYFGVSAAAFI